MKKFIFVSSLFLIAALCITVGLFFYLHSQNQTLPVSDPQPVVADDDPKSEQSLKTQDSSQEPPAPEGIPIRDLTLTEKQRSAIELVGIDVDTFVITDAMISCGERSLGVERYREIIDGDTPTFIESSKLIPCLSAQ